MKKREKEGKGSITSRCWIFSPSLGPGWAADSFPEGLGFLVQADV